MRLSECAKNKSEKEEDGRMLIHLVFEKVTDKAVWSEICACLCCKMMN
jgi:translation initiation factor 4G